MQTQTEIQAFLDMHKAVMHEYQIKQQEAMQRIQANTDQQKAALALHHATMHKLETQQHADMQIIMDSLAQHKADMLVFSKCINS
jgi:hypothetical protein